ncbi:MAG TPA: LacI family DNA-binding transcriptional regulator [Armatimonadota bacterium]|jgi:DNA-binding LacI/PurR family transcriptional regulator
MATIRQLAELAGVSTCTVSLALRDHPRISPATRQHVKDIASMYHYQSNRLAHGAITGKSATLGVVTGKIGAPYYCHILQGIVEAAVAESYHVNILQSSGIVHMCRAIQALVEQRVEGIFIVTSDFNLVPHDYMLMMRSNGVVPIGVGMVITPQFTDVVTTNEAQAANTITDYLYGLGHREIAYMSVLSRAHPLDRAAAMRIALQQRHLSTEHFIDLWESSTEEAFGLLVRKHAQVTAVITMWDMIAAELLQSATRRGIRVPQDLSVVSCGNLYLSPYLTPPLTTIEQHPIEVGKRAVVLMMQRLAAGKPAAASPPPEILSCDVELIKRDSCAPPRKQSLLLSRT